MCIVLNAKDICVTGRKLTDKVYYGHTGYIGHLKERTLKDQMAKDPTEVIHKVVLRMVPKNKLRDASAGIREVHFLPFNPEQIMILWNLREDAERKVHAIIDEFAERGLRSPAVAKQDSPMRGPAQQFLTLRAFGALPIVIALAAQGTFRGFKDTKTPLYAVGGLLIGRTLAVFITIRLTTSEAAKLGPIPMAGHEICMQVWLSISLLTDALALAGQTLLASSYSMGNYEQARLIIYRVIQIGLGAGITLSLILFFGFGAFASLFSTDSEVLDVSRSGILFVAGSQPVNALAFVIDGIYYGVSDFEYAAYSMVLVGLVSSIFLVVAAPVLRLPGVWTGLFIFMALRVLAGVWRLSSKSGPWDMIWYKDEQKTD